MAKKQPGANDKFEFYKDNKKEWRWSRTAPNGREVGASSEGYKNKSDCEDNAKRLGWDGKEKRS
jgi:uncharacterized protein YegP (UPF0339 family)